jgi:hypothetical protein
MLINYEPNTVGYLDITFGPKWDYIPLTKNYVENFLLINVIDKQNISKIAMSASELLENAVKFSSKDGIRMMIRKLDKKNQVELIVFNHVVKKEAEKVGQLVDEMNKMEPLQYYIGKMKESVSRKDGKAGLGLARINYEGEAKINVKFYDDIEVIQVKAVFQLV